MTGPNDSADPSSEAPGPTRVPDPRPFPPLPVVASERIYHSWWVGLRRDVLGLAGGATQEHHVVEIGDAVAIVPIRTDGSIVLVGQFRHAHGRTCWEVPAGRLEDGEAPVPGALRELREETGHTTSGLVPLPGFFPINGISAHWAHIFVAKDCEATHELDLDPSERLVVQTFSPDEVDALLREGRLVDGFTALSLLYARYLGHWGDSPRA